MKSTYAQILVSKWAEISTGGKRLFRLQQKSDFGAVDGIQYLNSYSAELVVPDDSFLSVEGLKKYCQAIAEEWGGVFVFNKDGRWLYKTIGGDIGILVHLDDGDVIKIDVSLIVE